MVPSNLTEFEKNPCIKVIISFNPFRPYLLCTLLLMANTTNRFKTLLVLTYHNQMKTEHQQLYIMLQFRGLLSSQKNSFVAPRSILFCFFIDHDKNTFFTCSKLNSTSEDSIGYQKMTKSTVRQLLQSSQLCTMCLILGLVIDFKRAVRIVS